MHALRNDKFLDGELGESVVVNELGTEDMVSNPENWRFVRSYEGSDNLFVGDDCDEEFSDNDDDECDFNDEIND